MKKLMWVEWDDDAHLSTSRKKPGAYSPLTRDSEDRLGHVTLSDAEDAENEPSSVWRSDVDPDDDWDSEDFEQQVEAVVAVLTILGHGVAWAAPHVRHWWSDHAKPAITERGRKVRAKVLRRPGWSGTAVDAAHLPANVEPTGPVMSSAEAQQRLASAVIATAYANEQMRLLRNARIPADDDPLELADAMRELTPERIQSTIQMLLQADPTMLDHDKLAALERALADSELPSVESAQELPYTLPNDE